MNGKIESSYISNTGGTNRAWGQALSARAMGHLSDLSVIILRDYEGSV